MDFVNEWSEKTEVPQVRFVSLLHIRRSKFCDWKKRYGMVNEHNALVPRDHWLELWEKKAIIDYYMTHPLDGYRRLTFMMLDQDVVAVSPSSVYRVLAAEGLLSRWNRKRSKKGDGFTQPTEPHEHWHVDIAYLNLGGTFYYLCAVLDGYSRYIVHWKILSSMTEADVELVIQRAREAHPGVKPRIISDNGPQFIARDFKEFIKLTGMTHVRTSPYYPQSNGKIERAFRTIKGEGLRPASPHTEGEARRAVGSFVSHYNECRLHSGIGYVTPKDKLEAREQEIFAERDRKLEAARELRRRARARLLPAPCEAPCEPEAVPA